MGLFGFDVSRTKKFTENEVNDLMKSVESRFMETLKIANLQGLSTGPYAANVTTDKALSLSAVWACVKLLSDTFASLPFHIYRENEEGKLIIPHNVSNLIKKQPTEYTTSYVWHQLGMSKLLLDGNFICWIERNDVSGKPTKLVPILNEFKIVTVENELFYKFKYNDQTETIPERDIFHVKGFTDDGLYGKSLIAAHRDMLSIGVSSQKASKDFYEKGAKMDGYLSTDSVLKEDTYKRVKDSFNSRNEERVPLLDGGLKFYQLKLNPQDAQYIESRKFTELDIARIFRVPPHMIGIMDRATWSNVEAMGIEFSKYTMLPLCTNWEQEINKKLLTEREKEDHYCRYNLEGLMRGDMKTRYESYKVAIQNGFKSINEVRALEDMNPIEGGDKHFVQGNNMVDINSMESITDTEDNNDEENGTEE